jgi:protein-S-isoprenylcysteine O-methyltransferase Ste14
MKKMNPLTLMFTSLLAMLALHWIIPLASISSLWLAIFGIALIAFGLVMAIGAESQFRKRGTTVDHLGKATKLVTDGWFQYSRNPMYLSFLVLLVGAGLSLGSLSPLLIIPVFVILTEQSFITQEENRLLATFGKEYRAYQRRTRRWL